MSETTVQRFILILLALVLLFYTGIRAHLLSMTHDEAHTVNAFMRIDVWNCFWNIGCWEIANNHLLNTWLIQKSTALFGVSEFTIRLPNLFAHSLFLASSIGILLNTNRKTWLLVAGFCIINMNPYLLDFFSMARGYGLFTGFIMASLFGLLKFIQQPNSKWSIFIFVMLFLAVMSNFTALNPALCLLTLYIFLSLVFLQINKIKRSQLWQLASIPVIWVVLLSWLLYLPINTLKTKGEFLWGAPSILNTFDTLLKDSLYHEAYFGINTIPIFNGLLLVLFGLILVVSVYRISRDYSKSQHIYFFSIALLLLGSCLFMLVQHWILGSQYLVNRKAVHFIPFIGLGAYLLLHEIPTSKFKTVFTFVVILFFSNHLIRTFNLKSTREWYYDEDTREMMIEMNAHKKADQQISLGTNWLFMPAANFYKNHFNYEFMEPLVYSKTIEADGRYDYYYVEGGDYKILETNYEILKPFGGGRLLLRKK